jgi:hypothetical protein
MSYSIQLTMQSRNSKVGPIPVSTTSRNTCPSACPLKDNGCYAEAGPLGILWRALSQTRPGETYTRGNATMQSLTWDQFTDKIAALPTGTLWRHNQAGDLPGLDNDVDTVALAKLARANKGKRGFTYTHKPLNRRNAAAIKQANAAGFTINLSADNLEEADQLTDAAVGPVVVVLPHDVQGNRKNVVTPKGRRVSVCPATYLENVSCASCQLCQRQERKVIVGFPAHGASKRKASAIANERA